MGSLSGLHRPSLLLLSLLGVIAIVNAAFLGEQLPLKVIATTPTTLLLGNETIMLLGNQALTAIFSRPVIALGADFGAAALPSDKVPFELTCGAPGKLRWLDTNIARFDPDGEWPSDLSCRLIWNEDLETFDGASFQVPDASSVRLKTESMTFKISDVISPRLQNITGGVWSAKDGMKDDILPEVPPDGQLQVSFTHPVNLQDIQDALQVVPAADLDDDDDSSSSDSGPGLDFDVLRCFEGKVPPKNVTQAPGYLDISATCAQIIIKDKLEPATEYMLLLPKDSMYNDHSGLTRRDITASFGGPRLFRLPLRSDFSKFLPKNETRKAKTRSDVSFRREQLWLVHGLSPSTSLSELEEAMSLCITDAVPGKQRDDVQCTPVPFTLSKGEQAGVLVMNIPSLMPRRQYRLSIKGSSGVRDGLGLPLQPSSNSWWTAALPEIFQGPTISSGNDMAVFSLRDNRVVPWSYLSRGPTGRYASYWAINANDPDEMMKALAMFTSRWYGPDVESYLGPADGRLKADGSEDYLVMDMLLKGSPQSLYLVHTCCQQNQEISKEGKESSLSVNLVAATNLSLSIIQSNGMATAWLIDPQAGGAPVEGGIVTLYRSVQDGDKFQGEIVNVCVTAANGTCDMTWKFPSDDPKLMNTGANLIAAAVAKRQVALVPYIGWEYQVNQPKHTYITTTIVDRTLVRPGDTLHVTVYVQEQVQGKLQLPTNLTHINITVSPSFDRNKELVNVPREVTTVPFDSTIGSAHANITIPLTAPRQNYVVGNDLVQYQGDVFILVAEPRPPTAELNLTVPQWAKPGSKVPISAEVVSYLGADVEGANLTLTWSAGAAKGKVYLITDRDGIAEGVVDLSDLPPQNATKEGDFMSVTLEWIGPTRELLSKNAYIPLHKSNIQLSISPVGATLEIPGITNAYRIVAYPSAYNEYKEVPNIPVKVTLIPGSDVECPNATLPSCVINTGLDPRSLCRLALPCLGTFTLNACAIGNEYEYSDFVDDDAACTNTTIGRNRTDWERQPFTTNPYISLYADQDQYSLGDTVKLYFNNPWRGAQALLRWGNGLRYKQLIRWVAQGLVTLQFPADEDCTPSCNVAMILAVGPNAYGSNPLPVPIGKTFNPSAPFTLTSTLDVQIKLADNVLNVTLDLGTPSDGDEVVLSPGATATWGVKVTHDDSPVTGAEVTLIAVDKSVLDLMPYPLQDPALSMRPSLSVYQQCSAQPDAVTPSAMDLVFNMALSRAGLDPWVPQDTNLQPTSYGVSPIDQSTKEYFKQFYTAITYFPGNGYKKKNMVATTTMITSTMITWAVATTATMLTMRRLIVKIKDWSLHNHQARSAQQNLELPKISNQLRCSR